MCTHPSRSRISKCSCVAVWCSMLQSVAVPCRYAHTHRALQSLSAPVVQCVAVWCRVVLCVAVWCSVVPCVAVWCSVLPCGAVCCRVVPCVAVWCSVVQCVAVCCSVLPCGAVWCRVVPCGAVCCRVVQCGAMCCRVVQCVAVCCRMLQSVAVPCRHVHTGWLQWVGSIKFYVSFAKETYKRDNILQKRRIILSILLTVATPYPSRSAISRCSYLAACYHGLQCVTLRCGVSRTVTRAL